MPIVIYFCSNCCSGEIKHVYLGCSNRFMLLGCIHGISQSCGEPIVGDPTSWLLFLACMVPMTPAIINITIDHSNTNAQIVVVLQLGKSIVGGPMNLGFFLYVHMMPHTPAVTTISIDNSNIGAQIVGVVLQLGKPIVGVPTSLGFFFLRVWCL